MHKYKASSGSGIILLIIDSKQSNSKIISKIYELVIIEILKNLLYSKGFEYIENDLPAMVNL